jgi:excisionase family DNA binding protein
MNTQQTPFAPELLSVEAAASRLSVSEATVRRLVSVKRLPSVRIGNQIRIAVRAVDELIAAAGGGGVSTNVERDSAPVPCSMVCGSSETMT